MTKINTSQNQKHNLCLTGGRLTKLLRLSIKTRIAKERDMSLHMRDNQQTQLRQK